MQAVTMWNYSNLGIRQRFCIHVGQVNDIEWIAEDMFASCSFNRVQLSRVGVPAPLKTFKFPVSQTPPEIITNNRRT